MKKYLICLLLVCVGFAFAQTKSVDNEKSTATTIPLARVTCAKTTHDIGKIPQGTPVTFVFQFKNEGKKPLVINDVSTPCGCTTPMFEKEKPFETGTAAPIDITFNAATEGTFEKTVTVTYNGTSTIDLTIKGEVVATETPVADRQKNTKD